MKKLILWLSLCLLFKSCGDVAGGSATDSDGVASDEHRIFISSSTHDGNLGGISGANTICANLASGAGLTRTYKAVLSDDSNAADSSGGLQFVGSIFVVDSSGEKTVVAGSGSELWGTDSNNLTATINVNESGTTITSTVNTWTGTNSNGGSQTDNCTNWSSNSSSVLGQIGNSSFTNDQWVETGTTNCNTTLRIYCVSQDD